VPGSYPFVLQAANGIGDAAEQQLTLAVTGGQPAAGAHT